MTEYVLIEDPGHAWLRVKMAELRALGINFRISNCSYRMGKFAYLEEDCDLPIFLEAMAKAGKPATIDTRYEEVTDIRDMSHYWPN